MEDELRKTGINNIGDAPWGTHFCQFYETKEDLIDVLVPYLKAGLENNEFCMWVTSEPLSEEEAKRAMRRGVPDFDRYLKRGQIEIVPHTEWYLKDGAFNLRRVLNAWIDKLSQALAKGYDGIRVTGNAAWLEKGDWRNFADYEQEVNNAIGKHRMLAICTYSLDKCGASEVIDVVRSHQFALIRRRGEWELVESSELKRVKEALKGSEERYRSLVELAPDGIVTVDMKGVITSCNTAATRIVGYSKDEIVGKHFSKLGFLRAGDIPKYLKLFSSILRGKVPEPFEVTWQRKDGTPHSAEIRVSLMKKDGKTIGIQAIARDITERRKAEEKLRFWKEFNERIVNSLGDALLVIDPNNYTVISANEAALKQLKLRREDLIGKTCYEITHHRSTPCKPPHDICPIQEMLKTGKAVTVEHTHFDKDNNEILVEVSAHPVRNQEGNIVQVVHLSRDITERKRTEEKLRESEERFRNLYESIQDPLAVYVGREGRLIEYNKAFKKRTGYTDEELKDKTFLDFVHPDDQAMVLEKYRMKYPEEKLPLVYEIRAVNKKGETIPIEVSVSPYKVKGKVVGIEVIHRDITERKKAEKEIRKAQERFSGIYNSSKDAIGYASLEGVLLDVNDSFCKLTGYSREELLAGKKYQDITPKEYHEYEARIIERILRTGKPAEYEKEYVRKDGSRVPILLTTFVVKGDDGKPIGLAAIIKDITERKRAEQAIRESQEKFKGLFMGNPEAAVYLDPDSHILDVNPRFEELFGYALDEIKGRHINDVVVPKDKMEEAEMVDKKALEGYFYYYDTVRKRKDGSLVPVSLSAAPITVESKLIGYVVLYKDITERKQKEEALRRSEEQARRLLEFQSKVIDTAVVWINLLDVEGNVTLWNRAAELISGYPREEVIGHKKIWEWLYPDPKYRARIFAQAKKIIERGERVENFETTIRCKDGTFKTISWYSNNILDEKGKLAGSIAVGVDITEIKKAQEKVRESEEKYRNLFENARDVIVTFDLKGDVTSVNKAVAEYGFKEEEIVGKNMLKFVSKKYWPKLLMELAKIARGKPVEGEIEMITPQGKKIVEYRSNPIRQGKKVVGFQTILRDITERKRFEERLSALNTYSLDLNMAESMEEIYRLTLDAMEKTLGFENASFMVANKDLLCVVDQRGFPESHASFKLPLNGTKGGVTVRAAKTGRPVLVPDTKKERAYVESVPGLRSELAVPIKIGHRVLGVLNVESKRLDAFDEKDQKLLEILASHAAIAISNLEYAKNLEKLVQERTKELRESQKQLLRSERLAAFGELAAMVGHDLRNPLQAITNASYVVNEMMSSCVDFVGKKSSILPPLRKEISEKYTKLMEMMNVIDRSIKYANKIVADLQDFARTKEPELIEVDLESLIRETLSDISIPENVRVSIRHDQALSKLCVDPTQIRRVFTNLTTNAIQAMPNGGKLTISTSLKDGLASIAFQDTGVGIPKEDMEKLFTPLFTTKPKGVGLGLAICKNIVEAHGGSIEVESREGKGSTFTVKLPVKKRR